MCAFTKSQAICVVNKVHNKIINKIHLTATVRLFLVVVSLFLFFFFALNILLVGP